MNAQVVRIAELDIDPVHLSDYTRLLAEEIEASVEREPGVLMLHAVSINESPNHVRLLEVYADQPAYEAHLKTPHFLRYKTGTAHMVRSLRLVDVTPIRMRSK